MPKKLRKENNKEINSFSVTWGLVLPSMFLLNKKTNNLLLETLCFWEMRKKKLLVCCHIVFSFEKVSVKMLLMASVFLTSLFLFCWQDEKNSWHFCEVLPDKEKLNCGCENEMNLLSVEEFPLKSFYFVLSEYKKRTHSINQYQLSIINDPKTITIHYQLL